MNKTVETVKISRKTGAKKRKNWIIKVLEGLPNLLRGFREGFTIKTSIVVEGSL